MEGEKGKKLDIPTVPCHICHGRRFWYRKNIGPGEWLCCRCHPDPAGAPRITLGLAKKDRG